MRRRDLERLIRRAGSVAALSRGINRSASTIRRWRRHGLPKRRFAHKAAEEELLSFRALLAEVSNRAKRDRDTFEGLISDPSSRRKLPKVKSKSSAYVGKRASGHQWVRGVNCLLNPAVHAHILVWMESLLEKRRWPLWMAKAVLSYYGDARHESHGNEPGSETLIVMVPVEKGKFRKEKEHFSLYIVSSTHAREKLDNVIDDMDDLLQNAVDRGLLVYVHSVTVYNYARRTHQQMNDWIAAQRRRKRRKEEQWEKRHGRKKPKPKRRKKKTVKSILPKYVGREFEPKPKRVAKKMLKKLTRKRHS